MMCGEGSVSWLQFLTSIYSKVPSPVTIPTTVPVSTDLYARWEI